MRQMMTKQTVMDNCNNFKNLFDKYIDFSDGKAFAVNNADWLWDLNYIEFIRDIGRHFSVNRMLRAECFKQRLETGLSFLEFNYMLMQSYDFLQLYKKHGVKMQFGEDDQWSNIIGGIDLVRSEADGQAYGMTFALLTTSEGKKMGKTQKGALWLDERKTSVYDFYQYWRNVEDADVHKCLSMLTFLPMKEVERLAALEGAEINRAKEVLAFEVTKLVHGEEKAHRAQDAARALFAGGADMSNVPKTTIDASEFDGEGIGVVSLMKRVGLVPSNGEGFRTIEQGGLSINGAKISDKKLYVTKDLFDEDGKLLIKKGKKTFHMIELG